MHNYEFLTDDNAADVGAASAVNAASAVKGSVIDTNTSGDNLIGVSAADSLLFESTHYALADPDMAFGVGALLYVPAVSSRIAEKILSDEFSSVNSLAFCLEDSIRDEALPLAESELLETMRRLCLSDLAMENRKNAAPMIFVRIRNAAHMLSVYNQLCEFSEPLTGFILPKFDLTNIAEYSEAICDINASRADKPLYIMPILESESLIPLASRVGVLSELHRRLAFIAEYVLNIRVGGNDIINFFGLRRGSDQTIYDIGVVREILFDILNVFSRDYVVSGPVWEYFDSGAENTSWLTGLKRELELDRLNGFIGKTTIHPSQVPVINESLRVSASDYADALEIMNWSSLTSGVAKSASGMRMNEVKVHRKWADRVLRLARIYGVREEC
jgi:citrate lyase beta subunit